MQDLVRVAFLGVAGVLLAVQFKGQKPEYGVYIGLAIGILVFGHALRQVEAVTAQFESCGAIWEEWRVILPFC